LPKVLLAVTNVVAGSIILVTTQMISTIHDFDITYITIEISVVALVLVMVAFAAYKGWLTRAVAKGSGWWTLLTAMVCLAASGCYTAYTFAYINQGPGTIRGICSPCTIGGHPTNRSTWFLGLNSMLLLGLAGLIGWSLRKRQQAAARPGIALNQSLST
jgi:hypothetical protein